jgi:hypothetical protein
MERDHNAAEIETLDRAKPNRRPAVARPEAVEAYFRPLGRELANKLRRQGAIAKARGVQRANAPPPGSWHEARAKNLDLPLPLHLDNCGTKAMSLRCGCQTLHIRKGCGRNELCRTCQRQRRERYRRRLRKATAWHESECRGVRIAPGPGQQLKWVMITLTCEHTGNLAADRDTIQGGWRRFHEWLVQHIHATRVARGAAGPKETPWRPQYSLAWELTPGDDGLGHAHAHVICLLPRFNFAKAHKVWREACEASGGYTRQLNMRPDGRGNHKAAAEYLAKYVSKVCDDELPADLTAQWLGATYGKKQIQASHNWWQDGDAKFCTCCGVPWSAVGVTEWPPPADDCKGKIGEFGYLVPYDYGKDIDDF